jgi:hypothetical protein
MLNMHNGQKSFNQKKSCYLVHDSEHKTTWVSVLAFFPMCDVAKVAVMHKLIHKPI